MTSGSLIKFPMDSEWYGGTTAFPHGFEKAQGLTDRGLADVKESFGQEEVML